MKRPRGLPDAELEGRPHLVVDAEARAALAELVAALLLQALAGGADEDSRQEGGQVIPSA